MNLINHEAPAQSSNRIVHYNSFVLLSFIVTEMACYYCVNVTSNEICNRFAIERPCPTGDYNVEI